MNITKLSAYLEEFLALKRTMAEADPNYDASDRRSLRHKEKLLKNFLAFWQHHGRPWPIRAADVLDWLAAESHPQHPYRGQHCFYTLRAFLQQVRAFEPETEVPDKIFKFRRPRRTPHLFSEREIVQLMRATRRLRLFETFRPLTLRTMIGLFGEHRSAHWGSPQTENRGSQVNGQSALSDDLRNEIWQIAKCCSACYDGAPFKKIYSSKEDES